MRGAHEQGRSWAAIWAKHNDDEFGPISGDFGWYVFKVRQVSRRQPIPLRDPASSIRELLGYERQRQAIEDFVTAYRKRWLALTRCALGYRADDCGSELVMPVG